MREPAIRSGDEPAHARSPLRLRLGLSVFGAVWGTIGTLVFLHLRAPLLAGGFGITTLVAVIDAAVVVRHLRQGPHYQPGPDVPPYRPVEPDPGPRPPPRPPVIPAVRLRRYLILMGICLGLLVVAWGWARLVSTGLAVAMTLVAMVIPPIAAIVATMGALQTGPDDEDRRPLGRRQPPVPPDGG